MASTWLARSWRRTAGLTGFAALALTTQHLTAPGGESTGTAETPREAPLQAQGRRLEVLFLGNPDGHRTTDLASMLAAQWAEHGLNIWFTSDQAKLSDTLLRRYDVLIVSGNHENLTPEREQALVNFVSGGKGLVVIHAGSASWGNSPRYIGLVGGQFRTHGGEEFQAKILQPNHPIFDSVKEFKTWD